MDFGGLGRIDGQLKYAEAREVRWGYLVGRGRERWFGKLKPMSSTEMLMKMAARLRNVSQ